MTVPLTFPGVYVREAPSGVRTITGVPTSVAAFVGRARRGPTDTPRTVNSYGDFERAFGGLWSESALAFAVRDFFRNGGGQAVVVRLFHAVEVEEGEDPVPAHAELTIGGLVLRATEPGSWGNDLRARVDHATREPDAALGEDADSLFNLYVRDGSTGRIEVHRNLTVLTGHPRRATEILAKDSRLVEVATLPGARPGESDAPQPGEDEWGDNTPATNVAVAEADRATDGEALDVDDFTGEGKAADHEGLYALDHADLFNLLCLPPYLATDGVANSDVDTDLVGEAAAYCRARRAVLLVDPRSDWQTKDDARDNVDDLGTRSDHAATYFPRLLQPDPTREGQVLPFAPSGAVAGVIARTDAQRGVWKAPAGLEAALVGVPALEVPLTDAENGELNPLGINCLRALPAAGRVVWGARTLAGADRLASEWKYLPVRRTALYIEESLFRGTQWVVFEPNDEPLWAQIRLNVGAFMDSLFRQGAFAGTTPREAYFVRCDSETTTADDVNRGVVNVVVGFAPLKPAEFVVITLQQIAGQVEV